MSFETINYEINENVATITFNRPDALNALSFQLVKDLTSAIGKAVEDKARAIILTGAGRAFCSGGDLAEMLKGQKSGNMILDPLVAMHNAVKLIRETPIPFIAAVSGICAGAGTNFALACDLIFASEQSGFNEAFVKIGLTPDCGGSFFLPRVVGEKIAAEIFMTGDAVSAERALQLGMINRVVAAELLMEETLKMAKKLSLTSTAGIGRIKKMMNATFSNRLDEQLDLEAKMQIESATSPDFKEGVQAFFEKRAPNFNGN